MANSHLSKSQCADTTDSDIGILTLHFVVVVSLALRTFASQHSTWLYTALPHCLLTRWLVWNHDSSIGLVCTREGRETLCVALSSCSRYRCCRGRYCIYWGQHQVSFPLKRYSLHVLGSTVTQSSEFWFRRYRLYSKGNFMFWDYFFKRYLIVTSCRLWIFI